MPSMNSNEGKTAVRGGLSYFSFRGICGSSARRKERMGEKTGKQKASIEKNRFL